MTDTTEGSNVGAGLRGAEREGEVDGADGVKVSFDEDMAGMRGIVVID